MPCLHCKVKHEHLRSHQLSQWTGKFISFIKMTAASIAGRGPEVLGVAGLFLSLTTIAIALRCYCRALVVKSFGLDDWSALLAWVKSLQIHFLWCVQADGRPGLLCFLLHLRHQWCPPWYWTACHKPPTHNCSCRTQGMW